jgi:hypothetical protein
LASVWRPSERKNPEVRQEVILSTPLTS